ncbi:putative O-glycosylation ligase, exosortase A system-associated [Paracraurococcus ruber]|uniref:O-glycosylation ligase, exosortase A system-associated n=1 Tax=Paracraurococcus ruber TaxID=77675 RepID=A0ABS1CV60_9PROT|nr:putative O-glycosylation ligase, exosortase A system-associated [Paracraurococcus ruber]MBK1658284.1 putative O-glycosylation ligase, exosortase A system-associated [Paracraurococcus ruber]TDG31011.1 putative O-glycosylation ligase, exosortase A system-associated [Paracraurococcus ruber]
MRSYVFLAFFAVLLPMAAALPFVGALLWAWISFMSPHREVWGFATNQPYAMVIFLATLLGCLIAREPKRFALNAVTVLLLLLAALFTFTSLTTLAPGPVTWKMWDRMMKTIAGAILVACLLTSRQRIHTMVWLIVISLGYYGVKGGIFTLMTGGGFRVLGPPDSMIADRNHLAVALLVAVPLMNWLRMHSAHRIVRLGLVAAMGLMVVSALGSQSRGALIALAATAVIFWLRGRGKIVSGVLIAACIAGTISFMPQSWVDRMNTISTYEQDASAVGRIRIWEASWKLALDRPLTGAGFRGPYFQEIVNRVAPGVTARAVHSIYFEVLGEHGFPTFLAWLGLTAAGGWYSWRLMRLARGRPDLAWAGDLGRMMQVSIVAYLSGGTFLSLSYWDVYWTLMVIVAAAHALAVQAVRQGAPVLPQPAALAAPGWRRPALPGLQGAGAPRTTGPGALT